MRAHILVDFAHGMPFLRLSLIILDIFVRLQLTHSWTGGRAATFGLSQGQAPSDQN